MRFVLVGTFAVGTFDSANMAICKEVGAENLLLPGLTVEQARELKLRGYRPGGPRKKASLREMLDFVGSDALAGGNRNLFRPFRDCSLYEEAFLVLADYRLVWTARRGSVPYGATRGCGPAQQSSTWRVWVSSHPTA
jgi:starch phosphorylase